jgi:hypothetical protein
MRFFLFKELDLKRERKSVHLLSYSLLLLLLLLSPIFLFIFIFLYHISLFCHFVSFFRFFVFSFFRFSALFFGCCFVVSFPMLGGRMPEIFLGLY